jgi:hypothetical protein
VERYDTGPELVRALWEGMAVPEAVEGAPDDDPIEALERVLATYGVTLEDAWGEFVLWAWQLVRFEDGDRYRRALRDQRWPSVPATRVAGESCRLTSDAPDGILPPLAGDYARFTSSEPGPRSARLAVRGPSGTRAFALVRSPGSPARVTSLVFGADGIASLDLELGGPGSSRVVLGVANGSGSPAPVDYSLRFAGSEAVVAEAPAVPSSVIFGTGTAASGIVLCGGAPAPFAHVAVTHREVASGASETTELVTDAFGRWSLGTVLAATSTLSVQVVDPLLSPATSASSTVGVRVAVNMSIADDEVEEGEPVTVEGNVAPVHGGRVVLERRRPNGRFEAAAESPLDAEGRYRFDQVLPAPGVWEVRVTMPDTGDADHLPGDSAPKLVQVGET